MKQIDYEIILLNLGELYWLAGTTKDQKKANQFREVANNILGVLRRTVTVEPKEGVKE